MSKHVLTTVRSYEMQRHLADPRYGDGLDIDSQKTCFVAKQECLSSIHDLTLVQEQELVCICRRCA